MIVNTKVDGWQVNADGARVQNGVVQTQQENEKISEHSKRTYSGNLRIYSKLEGYAFCLVINSGPYYRIHCGSEVIADKVAKLFGIYECKKFALRQVKERRKERAKKK